MRPSTGRTALIALGLSALLALLIQRIIAAVASGAGGGDVLVSWLGAVTVVTFLTYARDKAIAGTGRPRVPEATLLALALAGGTLGALAAMTLLRHKTAKRSFQLQLFLVLALQLAAVLVWYTVLTDR